MASSNVHLSLDDKKIILIQALKKKYQSLYDAIQPIPYIKDRLRSVDKIFVESGVIALFEKAASNRNDARWERLHSYKEIFNDPRLQFRRRIIEGEAGYGKSTLILQLAYEWCQDISDSTFSGVDILIVLKLRQLGKITSINRAIKSCLVPEEKRIKTKDIQTILEGCSSLKILLDGYDEYPDRDNDKQSDVGRLIRSEIFQKCDVTLTSRYLPKEYDQSNSKQFKLTGFDDFARDQYIRKAVTGDDEQAVAKVTKRIRENVILDELCQVPLFFASFAHMTHEDEELPKFKSITEFFRCMMECFHSHARNKASDFNVKTYPVQFEANQVQLDKIAFQSVCKESKQTTWVKKQLCAKVGQECYDHYIRVGILVEEDLFNSNTEQIDTGVRFYHQLICEWHAAHHVASVVAGEDNPAKIEELLRKLDHVDVPYVFRFAYGINFPCARRKLFEYLRGKEDGDNFHLLCVLEDTNSIDSVKRYIEPVCSRRVVFSSSDGRLLERSTYHLLQAASSLKMPITEVYLEWSFNKVDEKGNIWLKSGYCLKSLPSLEKLSINTYNAPISVEDFKGLANYALKSDNFKAIWFYASELPASFNSGTILAALKQRDIKVVRTDCAKQLDMQTGKWKKADNDLLSIKQLCSGVIPIINGQSKSNHQAVIEQLIKASENDIPIIEVSLVLSFDKVFDGEIWLTSGLCIPILATLASMAIQTEFGREFSEKELKKIIKYTQKSDKFDELCLAGCLLPYSVPPASLTKLIEKQNRVHWLPEGEESIAYTLDLYSGRWHKVIRGKRDRFNLREQVGGELTKQEHEQKVISIRMARILQQAVGGLNPS